MYNSNRKLIKKFPPRQFDFNFDRNESITLVFRIETTVKARIDANKRKKN